MNNLHDLPGAESSKPPSMWFWIKAGLGFGAGFCTMATVFGFVYWFLSVTLLLGILRGFARH
jgi:hypothetical protein